MLDEYLPFLGLKWLVSSNNNSSLGDFTPAYLFHDFMKNECRLTCLHKLFKMVFYGDENDCSQKGLSVQKTFVDKISQISSDGLVKYKYFILNSFAEGSQNTFPVLAIPYLRTC